MENGLQTDPENHLHHPIITLSPPQPEMNSLPIFPHPVQWHALPPRSLILAPLGAE